MFFETICRGFCFKEPFLDRVRVVFCPEEFVEAGFRAFRVKHFLGLEAV